MTSLLLSVLPKLSNHVGSIAPDHLHPLRKLYWYLTIHNPPLPKTLYDEIDIIYQNIGHPPLTHFAIHPYQSIQFHVWRGDITRLQVDAIVNAGNNQGLGCMVPTHRCIDNVIHEAAGPRLRLEESTILCGHEIPTGDAMITQGYHLPARYVITTVGPIYESTETSSPLLVKAYISCLELAKHNRIQSLVFPSISTGLFHYPVNDAALIAVKTVISWLKSNRNQHSLRLIIFNTFDDQTTDIYHNLTPLMKLD